MGFTWEFHFFIFLLQNEKICDILQIVQKLKYKKQLRHCIKEFLSNSYVVLSVKELSALWPFSLVLDLVFSAIGHTSFIKIFIQKSIWQKRTAAGLQLHREFHHSAYAYRCATQCFEGVQRGSIIIQYVRHCLRSAKTTITVQIFIARSRWKSWRICRRARLIPFVSVSSMTPIFRECLSKFN